jgi:hypothetical protein
MAGMLVEIDAVSGAGSEKSIATAAVAGASPMETTNAESALAAKQGSYEVVNQKKKRPSQQS